MDQRKLEPGVYPASVTPYDSEGRPDIAGFARLLAYFEAAGCSGAVIAGTNGEGPLLSYTEKRNLAQQLGFLKGKLELILGTASSSITEVVQLGIEAERGGFAALLVMPPPAYRDLDENSLSMWFRAILDRSPTPIIAYNYPKLAGTTITSRVLQELADHPNLIGVKDSSGVRENLPAFRSVLGGRHTLWVGNELLLLEALKAGWTGTISGAANLLPQWLSRIVFEWGNEDLRESAETKFELISPLIEQVRVGPQPALNKAVLHQLGVIDSPLARFPLQPPTETAVHAMLDSLQKTVGIHPGELALPKLSP